MVGGVVSKEEVNHAKSGQTLVNDIAVKRKDTTDHNFTQIQQKSNKQNDLSTTMTNSHYQNGGASSAWRSSVYSRGPVNYPNNGWYNGEKQFKQFTKTGQYISNTELPYAAAPISTGAVKDDNPIQGTVSDYLSQYAAYGSGKKKKTLTKKKTSTKKKSLTKKKKLVKRKSITKKTRKNTTLTVLTSKLGWRDAVRKKNLNKLLIKAHKLGMKKVIIDNWPDKDDVYVVQKEIRKRKL